MSPRPSKKKEVTTNFDEGLWRKRALKKRKQNRDHDIERFITGLRVVVEWCGARALSVKFQNQWGGMYDPIDKEVTISVRAPLHEQLYFLLHECGHHLIGPKERHQRYGMGYANMTPWAGNTNHHKLDVLEEEFEAWHRGWRLGIRLGVLNKGDKEAYDKIRVKMLKTYVRWVAKSG